MTDFEDRYDSMPELCKYLGSSRNSALKWIAKKDMPAHAAGKKRKLSFLRSTNRSTVVKRRNEEWDTK